jgi:hypothetical protein
MTVEDAMPQGVPSAGARPAHASTAIQVRGPVIFAAALTCAIILVQAVLALVMQQFAQREDQLQSSRPGHRALPVEEFPGPRLQQSPAAELARMRAEEKRRITTYGWIDEKARIAHIPVDRAMDILAKTGLPIVPAPAPVEGAPPGTFVPPATKREQPQDEPKQERRP